MSATSWTPDPLLAAANFAGSPELGMYGPTGVGGWNLKPSGEPDVPHTLTLLETALSLVDSATPVMDTDESVVELDGVDALISARMLAELAARTMTRVNAWACFTTYAAAWGELAGRRTVWSAHFSEVDANEWLDAWREHTAGNDAIEWHVAQIPVDVGTLRRPNARPVMPA